jgi:hypothetical protein
MKNCTKTNQQSGWQSEGLHAYIEENTCASQLMIGTSEDGVMGECLKPSKSSFLIANPQADDQTTH